MTLAIHGKISLLHWQPLLMKIFAYSSQLSRRLNTLIENGTSLDISNQLKKCFLYLTFLFLFLGKAIHQPNQLHHYQNAIHLFRDNFDVLCLAIDFSENLNILVKFEPQSVHWHHDTSTVHSGIVKLHEEKVIIVMHQIANNVTRHL